jgi:hypothetical protein
MYAIRYRKRSTGNEYVRFLSSWDEAMDVYSRLLSDPVRQIIPSRETGLDVESVGQSRPDDMPPSLQMLSKN